MALAVETVSENGLHQGGAEDRRDRAIERILDSEHVAWVFHEKMGLSHIDKEASKANQARFVALMDWLVDRYAAAMNAGDVLPPLVAYRNALGRLVLIDGNHRCHAACRVGLKHYPVYEVLSTEPAVVDRLTRAWNVHMGVAPSREEAIEQAIRLVHLHGYRAKDAAEQMHLAPTAVYEEMRVKEMLARFRASGLTAEQTLELSRNRSFVLRLATVELDPVLREVGLVFLEKGIPTKQKLDLLDAVNGLRSEQAKLALVAEWWQRPEVVALRALSKGGRVKTKRGENMKTAIGAVGVGIGRIRTALARPMPERERAEVRQLVKALVADLREWMGDAEA